MTTKIDNTVCTVLDIEIPFGKYKNMMLSKVIESDMNYISWLMSNKELIKKYPAIESFLNDKMIKKNEYYMTWGKYRNKALSDIYNIDEKYIKWLKDSKFVNESCPKLVEALSKFNL